MNKQKNTKTNTALIVLGAFVLAGGATWAFAKPWKGSPLFGYIPKGDRVSEPTGESTTGSFTGASASMGNLNVRDTFKRIGKQYTLQYIRDLEKMYRLETADFGSGQWLKCLSPGMVAVPGTNSFPWGWSSLEQYRKVNNLKVSDFGTVYFSTTSDGKPRSYIKFPNVYHNVNFTAWFIKEKRGGNIGAWFSTDKGKQVSYMAKVAAKSAIFN